MKYELIPLPYADDALAPVIGSETIAFHHGKHERAYVEKLNSLIEGTRYESMSLEDIITDSEGAIFNNAAQVWNHRFYFATFSPTARREPQGSLAEAILREWHSVDGFRKSFEDAGAALFGSGWVWLCSDNRGRLGIESCGNANTPLISGLSPLLTFDVWEHAYYIDYRNRRPDHLKALWSIVDWAVVESRYEAALGRE